MADVLDVAQYILEKNGPMPAMKLQKLCYYSQAWSLVWDDKELFDDRFEAWANGPVSPRLYQRHRLLFIVSESNIGGDPKKLDAEQRETVDAILDAFGGLEAAELSDMTHRETPWAEARGDLPVGARGTTEITKASMAEYYGALYAARD